MNDLRYCPTCAGPLELRVPHGDERERHVCSTCQQIHYQNPRVVVGSLPVWEGRLLLCRRAIEPRTGYWTLPAGFLELGETTAEGARREAREEAEADVELTGLLALYDLTPIGQVQVFYAGRLRSPDVRPGIESQEVGLFGWDEVPWGELAFPTVRWVLDYWRQVEGRAVFPPDLGARLREGREV